MVSFCEKCGALLIPRRHEDDTVTLVCRICKTESKDEFKESSYQISSKIIHDEKEKVTVVEEEFDIRPSIKVACPRCNHYEARYWEAENRRKEEWETTTYYKCTKCGWVWSE
ncbi:MAG: transcription factor S [Candidatus Heimdallarchaeota archaeon]|nr:MAG: transcription factor S [Candidatus Heimdallarchaeota archaeon]